jgi:hypothetical protein
MTSIRNGVDIVKLISGGNQGFCFRRPQLIKIMTEQKVFKWPRPMNGDEVVFHRIPPAYWVTNKSLKLVKHILPQWSLFDLKEVGKEKVGTVFGDLGAMHGAEVTIHELVPRKTREQVQNDLKLLPPPPPPSLQPSSTIGVANASTALVRIPSGLSDETKQRMMEMRAMMERNRLAALRALQPPSAQTSQMSVERRESKGQINRPIYMAAAAVLPPPPPPPAAAAAQRLGPQPVFHMTLRSRVPLPPPPPPATHPPGAHPPADMDVDRSAGFSRRTRTRKHLKRHND